MLDPMDRMNTARAASRTRVVLHEDDQGNLLNDNNQPVRVGENGELEVIVPAVAPAPVAEVPAVEVPAQPAVAPAVQPAPAAPAATEEFVAVEEWQATDETGKAIGPPSRIEGRGPTEAAALRVLAGKLRELNITAARKIKEYRDKYRTYDAEKTVLSFGDPEPLSPETKVQIARLLADPNTIDEGFKLLYQAQFGETPEQVRQRRAREEEAEQIRAGQSETVKFLREHPDFPSGPTAKKIVIDEMERRRDEAIASGSSFGFTAHNLEIVYDDLVEKGILVPRQLTTAPPAPVPPTSGNSDAAASSQIAPAPAPQVNTPPSASPASTPVDDANTPPAPGSRQRGTKFSVMSTEHGQPPAPADSRQTDDAAFRKLVDEMPLETLKRRIKSDRAFSKRLNEFKW